MLLASGDTERLPMRPIAQRASGVIKPPFISIWDLPMGFVAAVAPSPAACAAPVIVSADIIIAMLLFIIFFVFVFSCINMCFFTVYAN